MPLLYPAISSSEQFIAMPSLIELDIILPLISCSILLYFAGFIHNDLCDFEEDKELNRTQRPLVTQEISLRSARLGFFVCNLLAFCLAFYVSIYSLLTAVIIAFLSYSYNLWTRRFAYLGFANMALCRMLNIFLGASFYLFDQLRPIGSIILIISLVASLYIFIICRIAYDEEKKPPHQFWSKALLFIPVITCLISFAFFLLNL